MADIVEQLLEHAADIVNNAVPALAADALKRLADGQDDPLAKAAVGVLERIVRETGPEAAKAATDALVKLLERGDPTDLLNQGLDAAALTVLVDQLQTAEAARKAKAAEAIRKIGRVLVAVAFQALKAVV